MLMHPVLKLTDTVVVLIICKGLIVLNGSSAMVAVVHKLYSIIRHAVS